jgi:hypothetical protein
MLTSRCQAIAFTNSLDSMRNGHQFGEFRRSAWPHIDFVQVGGSLRRIRDTTDALNQICRQVTIARRKYGQSVNSIVAFVPRVQAFLRKFRAHRQAPVRIDNEAYFSNVTRSFFQAALSGQSQCTLSTLGRSVIRMDAHAQFDIQHTTP